MLLVIIAVVFSSEDDEQNAFENNNVPMKPTSNSRTVRIDTRNKSSRLPVKTSANDEYSSSRPMTSVSNNISTDPSGLSNDFYESSLVKSVTFLDDNLTKSYENIASMTMPCLHKHSIATKFAHNNMSMDGPQSSPLFSDESNESCACISSHAPNVIINANKLSHPLGKTSQSILNVEQRTPMKSSLKTHRIKSSRASSAMKLSTVDTQ
jgi:hypothetical protein